MSLCSLFLSALSLGAGTQEKGWPEDYQVTIDLSLNKRPPGKKYRRPYLAVWIENEKGRRIRTLTVWGRKHKYVRTLTEWWRKAPRDRREVDAFTHPTRRPGRHSLIWDGKDDSGKHVNRGSYTIRVEVRREHGTHVRNMKAKLACEGTIETATFKPNVEVTKSAVRYGPKE